MHDARHTFSHPGTATMVNRGEKRPAPDSDDRNDDEGPACQSCRKRKAKCSRQQPCQQCVKLRVDCVYDESRQRPGMRPGVVEALNQRLTSLEQMFIGQGLLLRPLLGQMGSPSNPPGSQSDLDGQVNALRHELLGYANGSPIPQLRDVRAPLPNSDCPVVPHSSVPTPADVQPLTAPTLPPIEVVDRLVELYFEEIHPWIPVLHVSETKRKLEDPIQREKLTTVLLAIVSVCLRIDNSDYARAPHDLKAVCLRYRHAVILRSMETFSVQNLQALVIVSFDILGSGRGPSAWSVVGSMARTVEQLQLSVEERTDEPSEAGKHSLISRMAFLKPPQTWVETEERRRVFWTVFLMDRFCSVATGWNNSLTGADVRRRLPCEGALWEAARPVRTPFFGIAERSPMSSQTAQTLTPRSERHPTDEEEVNNIGGFAFCIEATESLNLVTTFFLRQAVNFDNTNELQIWLLKFKELDLRLVRWRLFLPSRWNDARAPNSKGRMDPNLALAHITHNTAVIQLHQCIAYPSPRWRSSSIALPSNTSADTCVTAATEIGSIAQQFLQMSSGVINPQFSFCLFVAGRVLLAHAVHHSTSLSDVFENVVTSLGTIAQRWNGSGVQNNDNLASRFASRLRQARASATGDLASRKNSLLDIRQPAYSDDMSSVPGTRRGSVHLDSVSLPPDMPPLDTAQTPPMGFSPDSMSLAFPPMPYSLQHHSGAFLPTENQVKPYMAPIAHGEQIMAPPGPEVQELTNYFDAPFEEMLRVSTYVGDFGSLQPNM
ncbi:hypothetical protein BU23DRAFT_220158 [Bimuria novae-zelandiae CBS 107.79]|uniref:Zn(2)-C6 fungal-type domain-containing protein n=1 Tax=Bimuria novae-zelandiae CBS 107.79 TaxID=1447943 RepID=A0A6A5V1W3_9PLEO|nr:hypothetical protein BU23DRAFT_220158 [Bimuria novae-zelandiae CBS 107.79]